MAQAQPQPNHQRLPDAFTAAAEECSHLSNIQLSVIANSQALVEAINQLRDGVTQLATRTTDRFDTLEAALTTVQADIATLRADVTTHHTNITARLNAR